MYKDSEAPFRFLKQLILLSAMISACHDTPKRLTYASLRAVRHVVIIVGLLAKGASGGEIGLVHYAA